MCYLLFGNDITRELDVLSLCSSLNLGHRWEDCEGMTTCIREEQGTNGYVDSGKNLI